MTTKNNYEYAEIIIVDSDGEEEEEKTLTQYTEYQEYKDIEYFVGYEIASLLGYKNTMSVIKNNVSKCNQLPFREFSGVKLPPLNPKSLLITRLGVTEMLLKTRKEVTPDVIHLLKEFGIRTTNMKCLSKEQNTLYSIINVCK